MLGSVRGVVSNDHSYRDKANPRVPTLFRVRKATRFGRTIARSERPGVVEEPGMCRSSLDGNREIPRLASRGAPLWPASGRRGAVADDERTWEVRLRNSSWEADEQSRATGCGVGWSQVRRPRGMRASKARAGCKTGKVCHRRWSAYGKSQGNGRRNGSPRSSTISVSNSSGWHSSDSTEML